MSKISTIYDAMTTLIAATLTTRKELANPYLITDNNGAWLRKGWGLRIGPGTDTNRSICDKLFVEQEMTIVLTERLEITKHNTTAFHTEMKALLEDYILMAKAIAAEPELSSSIKTIHLANSGIDFLEDDRSKHVFIEISVTTEFFETF